MASEPGCRSSLGLLGGWRLSVDGRPADAPPLARRLLALLALRGPLTRPQVTDILWPEIDEVTASCRLRTALWRSVGGRGLVDTRGGELALAHSVAVDVRHMRASARAVAEVHRAADQTTAWEAVGSQVTLFEQDLLPNWWDEWLVTERERIRQTRLHALEAISALYLSRKRYAEAVDAALAAVRAEPLRESAHRAVILAHLAEGNAVEAVRQFESCRVVLRQELGVAPSDALAALLPCRPAQQPNE